MAVLFTSLGENKAKASKEQNRIKFMQDYMNIQFALDEFKRDMGRLPNSDEGLDALVTGSAGAQGWKGPYLKKKPVDPFGTPYRYTIDGSKYHILSLGADGREGGEKEDADIDIGTLTNE